MKKSIGLVVVLCILLCTLTVAANEPPHNEFVWDVIDGVLIISGSGAIDDYRCESEIPWYENKSEITKIVVEEGITRIGNMAFYGLKNVTRAVIADSVESVGICAFSYTEGTRTSLGNLNADYQFTLESDSAVVSRGDTFTVSITLSGDFKDVNAVQSTLLFDKNKISIDQESWYDSEWYNNVGEDNLGYIAKPLAGIVANNLRLGYISMSGNRIDEGSPLYTAGKTDLVIAKVVCTALEDIEDVNTSCFMLKNSAVGLVADNASLVATSGENQLTSCTKLPIPGLEIHTNSKAVADYATEKAITVKSVLNKDSLPEKAEEIKVYVNDALTEMPTAPFVNDNGSVMIPLRAVMETMGVSVIWDGETSTVFMATDKDFAATQLGKKLVFKNETSIELDEASVAKDQRTLVSLDFFTKAFGFEAMWNEETSTATIK